MNAKNEQIETIERYLNRQLSPDEAVAFEHKIAQDETFAAEVAQHRLVHELITDRGLLDFKQKIQDSRYDQYFDQPKGKNYLLGGLAIGLLALSTSAYFLFSLPKKSEPIAVEKVQPIAPFPKSDSEETTDTSVLQPIKKTTHLPPKPVLKSKSPIVLHSNQEEPIVAEKTSELETMASDPISTTSKTDFLAEKEPIATNTLPSKIEEETKTEVQKSFVTKSSIKTMEFAFSPSLNQVWEFPMEENGNGKMTILNKSGQIVHETSILNGFPNSWNGTSNRGISVTMGSYIFLMEYENGRIEKGYVTVTQ